MQQASALVGNARSDHDIFTDLADRMGFKAGALAAGTQVAKGDLLARVWPLDRTGQPPVEYRARLAGLVISRHFPGLIKSGDCVAVVGVTGT